MHITYGVLVVAISALLTASLCCTELGSTRDTSSDTGYEVDTKDLMDITGLLPVLEYLKTLDGQICFRSLDSKPYVTQVHRDQVLELLDASIAILDNHCEEISDEAEFNHIVTTLKSYLSEAQGLDGLMRKRSPLNQSCLKDLAVRGNTSVGGSVIVKGDTKLNDLKVEGVLVARNDVTINGQLCVHGPVSLDTIKEVTACDHIAASAIDVKVLEISDKATIKGELAVTDKASFNSVAIDEGLSVKGVTHLTSLEAKDVTLGDAHVNGRFMVDDKAVFNDAVVLGSSPSSTVTISGNLHAASSTFDKAATFSGDVMLDSITGNLSVAGTSRLNKLTVNGDTLLRGNVTLGSAGTHVTICGKLNTPLLTGSCSCCDTLPDVLPVEDIQDNASGHLDVHGGATIDGDQRVMGSLAVEGSTVLHNAVAIDSPEGLTSLTVSGASIFNGPVTLAQPLSGPLHVIGDVVLDGNVSIRGRLTVPEGQILPAEKILAEYEQHQIVQPVQVVESIPESPQVFNNPVTFNEDVTFMQTVAGGMAINGDVTFNGNQLVIGDTTINGSATVHGDVTIGSQDGGSELVVWGLTDLKGPIIACGLDLGCALSNLVSNAQVFYAGTAITDASGSSTIEFNGTFTSNPYVIATLTSPIIAPALITVDVQSQDKAVITAWDVRDITRKIPGVTVNYMAIAQIPVEECEVL